MKKPKKVKSPRDSVKNAALVKKFNSRVRQEYIDQDYLDQLNPEELAWLNKFMSEYNNASFNNDSTDLDQSPEGRKEAYDRNNARNRCMFGLTKGKVANTKLIEYGSEIEDELAQDINPARLEDAYVDFIDQEEMKELEKFATELDELEDYAEYLDKVNEEPQE